MAFDGLSPRAESLLRTLVDMHIREGQPVGSKALHVESGMSVSPATIRNVMSDLEERGFLSSPHTSAGRVPTAQGYRLFVDSLLQMSPIDENAIQALKSELNPSRPSSELIASASNLLTQVTSQAGIVTVPKQRTSQLRQIEFLPLSDSRVLVIMVVNEKEVQNRVIELSQPLSEEQLRSAADWINRRYAGNDLAYVKRLIVAEMTEARSRIDEHLEAALQLAKDAMDVEDTKDEYVVAGERRLMQQASAGDMDKLRELFDADLDNLDQLSAEKLALFEEVSPIHHLTKDDAPALLTYMVKDSDLESGIHNPRFGHTLKKEMDKLVAKPSRGLVPWRRGGRERKGEFLTNN